MQQKEFETLIGTEVSRDTFDYVNRVYMAAGDLDKQTFASDWQDSFVSESKIVSALTLEVETQQNAVRNLKRQVSMDQEALQNFTDSMVDFLIIQAEKWSASDLRDKAIKLVGIKEYIRRRMEMKLGLWESDRLALLEILKKED